MDAKNGGPAFPVFIAAGDASADDVKRAVDAAGAVGLTVWDWFAGHAMQGYLAAFSGSDVRMPSPELAVRDVTRYADAMLAARPKPASDVARLGEALDRRPAMATNKPEVVAYLHINKENPGQRGVSLHHDAGCTSTLIHTEPLIRLSDYEALQAALQAECARLDRAAAGDGSGVAVGR